MIIKSIIADQLYSVSSILEKICYVSFIGSATRLECLSSVYINGDCTSQAAGAKASYVPFTISTSLHSRIPPE